MVSDDKGFFKSIFDFLKKEKKRKSQSKILSSGFKVQINKC